MRNKFEAFVSVVYKKWKQACVGTIEAHPDEEALACFLEGRLDKKEIERIKIHLINCRACLDALVLSLGLSKDMDPEAISDELLNHVKGLLLPKDGYSLLEIILRLKEKMLELVSTTGDVLVGQELVPAPVLRSRSIKDFKDEVTVLKDFKDKRVEVKLENKDGGAFKLIIIVKQKDTQQVLKDLRITLLRDELELESYLSTQGKVIFEHVLVGKYTVQICEMEKLAASVLLDIRK